MTRKEKQIIEYIQQYIHAKFGEEYKRGGRKGKQAIANEVVSALVDMYEFEKLYCYSQQSISDALQCSRSGHNKRIKRFKSKMEDTNFRSKATRIMEQCANEIERLYEFRLSDKRAAELSSSYKTAASNENSDGGGYTAFMATLSEMDS